MQSIGVGRKEHGVAVSSLPPAVCLCLPKETPGPGQHPQMHETENQEPK